MSINTKKRTSQRSRRIEGLLLLTLTGLVGAQLFLYNQYAPSSQVAAGQETSGLQVAEKASPYNAAQVALRIAPQVAAIASAPTLTGQASGSGDAQSAPLESATSTEITGKARALVMKAQSLFLDPNRNDALEEEIRRSAKRLNKEDLRRLARHVLNESSPALERDSSLYVLTEAGSIALPALAQIAAAHYVDKNISHSSGPSQNMALRLTALEALDRHADGEVQVAKLLENIIHQQKDPTLKYFAQVSLTGIAQGRPGKLVRMMNQISGEMESL